MCFNELAGLVVGVRYWYAHLAAKNHGRHNPDRITPWPSPPSPLRHGCGGV